MFLGEDLLPWLTLAIGAALAVGTALALLRPNDAASVADGELERPPIGRAAAQILLGTVASVWAIATLIS